MGDPSELLRCLGISSFAKRNKGFFSYLIFSLLSLMLVNCGTSNLPEAVSARSSEPPKQAAAAFTVTPYTASLYAGQSVQINAFGGTKPYSFIIPTGKGTVSAAGLFTAPSLAQSVQMTILDQNGQSARVTITVLQGSAPSTLSFPQGVAAASISSQGACPTGFSSKGGGLLGEILCAESTSSTPSTILSDFTVTQEGRHVVGGPGCPSGYAAVGTFADCGGGKCYGNQEICTLSVPATAGMTAGTYVRDILVLGSGSHTVGGPGCPAGYAQVATTADCSGGVCYGNLNFCVQK